jgi:hypothetical protein
MEYYITAQIASADSSLTEALVEIVDALSILDFLTMEETSAGEEESLIW